MLSGDDYELHAYIFGLHSCYSSHVGLVWLQLSGALMHLLIHLITWHIHVMSDKTTAAYPALHTTLLCTVTLTSDKREDKCLCF